jgi:hypothetical protein
VPRRGTSSEILHSLSLADPPSPAFRVVFNNSINHALSTFIRVIGEVTRPGNVDVQLSSGEALFEPSFCRPRLVDCGVRAIRGGSLKLVCSIESNDFTRNSFPIDGEDKQLPRDSRLRFNEDPDPSGIEASFLGYQCKPVSKVADRGACATVCLDSPVA